MGLLAHVSAAELRPILAGRFKPVHVLLGNAELERVANLTRPSIYRTPRHSSHAKWE